MRLTIASLFAAIVLTAGQSGANQEDFSSRRVPPIHVEGWGLDGVMQQVATKNHTNVGLELDVVMGTEGRLKLDFDGGTVAELAAKAASLLKGASWKIVGNRSVLIYTPGKAANFGATSLAYPGMTLATRRQVFEDLDNRPEIGRWLGLQNCKRMEVFMGREWERDQPSITIPGGTLNIGDILESSTSQSDRYFWTILANTRDGQCEIWATLW